MFNVGRVCFKIAGRDANKYCVVIKKIDNNFVEIDGQTRRRKCNIDHLEPLDKTIEIAEGASNKEVADALTKAGFETAEKKESKKSAGDKPVKQKVKHAKAAPAKKVAKKSETKKE